MREREHPTPVLLLRFLRCETSKTETRTILCHLLAGCGKCNALTRPVWKAIDRLSRGRRQAPSLRRIAGRRA